MSGFRKFLLRGNLVELAVAVVIGTAFAAAVTALVKDIITPLIAAIGGQPNFETMTFTINRSKFRIPIAARTCMYCTTDLTPPTTTAVP